MQRYGKELAIKSANLYKVSNNWLIATRSAAFSQVGMMQHFAAPGRYPPDLAVLKQRSAIADSVFFKSHVLEFWGPEVYCYMRKELPKCLANWRHSNKGMGANAWAFASAGCNSWHDVVLWSDGTSAGQQSSCSSQSAPDGAMWWPALCCHETDGRIVTWCQAFALSKSRPWICHNSRVHHLEESSAKATPLPYMPGFPKGYTGPTIEEVEDSEVEGVEEVDELKDVCF